MTSLIERIEAAAGPDPALKEDVLLALGWTQRDAMVFDPNGHRAMRIPDPLSSIDDAMTLCCSDVFIHLQDAIDAVQEEMPDASIGEQVAALPRFVCAAALRARGVE